MKKWVIPAACAAITAIVVGVVVLVPTEEDKVKKTVERFAKAVEPHPQANPAFELGRINDTFKDVLADHVEISVPEIPQVPSDRKQLAALAMQGGARYGEVDIGISDVTVKLDEGKTTAQVDCTAELREKGGRARKDKRRVHFFLRNDDHWRIATIHVAGVDAE